MANAPPHPKIVDALRSYAALRPDAVDTPRGIRDWWLGGVDPLPTIDEVEQSLLALEALGEFVSLRLPEGTVCWRPVAGDE